MVKLQWKRTSNVTTVKEDMKKYITPGEKEKLEYPAPPKQKVLDTMTKGEEGDLQYSTTKKATENVSIKEKDIREPGKKGDLEYSGKDAKWPTEGDVKSQDISNVAKQYMSKGQPGDIQKSKTFTAGDGANADTVKVDPKKHWLTFEKTSPMQKQFSKKSMSLSDWMDQLREQGVSRQVRRAFRYAWITASAEGKNPEEAALSTLETIKSGSTVPSGTEESTVPLPEVVGFVLTSFLKFSKECPECLKKLMAAVETYQYYPAMDVIESGSGTVEGPKESKTVSAASLEELEQKKLDLQKQLADIQKQIADLSQKQVNQEPQATPPA